MNTKVLIGVAGILVVAGIFFMAHQLEGGSVESIISNGEDDSILDVKTDSAPQPEAGSKTHTSVDKDHNEAHDHSHKDKDFDFEPYVSQEMRDELGQYTSRSKDGLEIEMDADGYESVNLKKRWSHATVSVVDENGVKHTGEWAPKQP